MIQCPRCNSSLTLRNKDQFDEMFVCTCDIIYSEHANRFWYNAGNKYRVSCHIKDNKTFINGDAHTFAILPGLMYNLTEEKIEKLLLLV